MQIHVTNGTSLHSCSTQNDHWSPSERYRRLYGGRLLK